MAAGEPAPRGNVPDALVGQTPPAHAVVVGQMPAPAKAGLHLVSAAAALGCAYGALHYGSLLGKNPGYVR